MNDAAAARPNPATSSQEWTLRDRGRDLVVEMWFADGRNHAQLSVDGKQVAAGDTDTLGDVKLVGAEAHVKVAFWWRGRVRSCELFDQGEDAPAAEDEEADPFQTFGRTVTRVPFAPPPGTRAARSHAWREAHPRWWAARHVAIQIGSILVAVLGISALVSALINKLIPRIDWSWLPSISVPEWLRYLNPFYWLGRLLPDWDWFGWVPEFDLPDLGWVKYVVVLAIAVGTGVREVRKRRERDERERAAQERESTSRDAER